MKQIRSVSTAVVLVLSLLISGSTLAQPESVPEFDRAAFSDSTRIDNPWFPYAPGSYWVYEGSTIEDGEEIPHRIEFTVTDMTKMIDGVNTVVAWVVDYSEGELVEAEIAFYAQADDGTVWYFGEYPEEYEDGEFIEAKPWLSGIEDAQAGITMLSDPQVGAESYFQGWGPEVEWSDYAVIDAMGEEFCVPTGCYEDVLVIAESSLEEDAFQLKYYASGIGNIGVGFRGEDPSQETLVLVEFGTLDAEQLAEINAMVLELEAHAYEISEAYSETEQIQPAMQ